MAKMVVLFLFFLLSGCHSLQVPPEFTYVPISTSSYTLASWQKITDKNLPYKIYIEGDGNSFNAFGQPTNDPTPKGTLLREIAFGDKHPNVVYLARPCQFIKDKRCQVNDWTIGRFSPKIVKSETDAVKKIADQQPITLVGFSGGAQIAGLIAVTEPNLRVNKLVSVAGNLDVVTWTDYHNVPDLSESLDLHNYQDEYTNFKQVHYLGEDDEIVPPEITISFVKDRNNIHIIKNASHNKGWEEAFTAIRGE